MFVVKVYCKSTIKIVVAVVVQKMSFCFVWRIETSIQTSNQTVFVSTPKLKMFIQRILTCIQTSNFLDIHAWHFPTPLKWIWKEKMPINVSQDIFNNFNFKITAICRQLAKVAGYVCWSTLQFGFLQSDPCFFHEIYHWIHSALRQIHGELTIHPLLRPPTGLIYFKHI